jgi:hypothetical protein
MITDETLHREILERRRASGVMEQQAITGDDWTSDRDKKRQAKAEAALKKASLACAVKMRAAADALHEQRMAFFEAGHEDKMGAADGRLRLATDLRELAGYFESVFDKGPTC